MNLLNHKLLKPLMVFLPFIFLPINGQAQTANAKTYFSLEFGVTSLLGKINEGHEKVKSLNPFGLNGRFSLGRSFGRFNQHRLGLNWAVFQVHAEYSKVPAYLNDPDREILPTMYLYYSQVVHAFSLDYGYCLKRGRFSMIPSVGLGGAFALTPHTEVDYAYKESSERWADITENNTLIENYYREVIINLGLRAEYKVNNHISFGIGTRLIASPSNISKNLILPVRTIIQLNDRKYKFSPAMTLKTLNHSLSFRYTF